MSFIQPQTAVVGSRQPLRSPRGQYETLTSAETGRHSSLSPPPRLSLVHDPGRAMRCSTLLQISTYRLPGCPALPRLVVAPRDDLRQLRESSSRSLDSRPPLTGPATAQMYVSCFYTLADRISLALERCGRLPVDVAASPANQSAPSNMAFSARFFTRSRPIHWLL